MESLETPLSAVWTFPRQKNNFYGLEQPKAGQRVELLNHTMQKPRLVSNRAVQRRFPFMVAASFRCYLRAIGALSTGWP